MPCRDPVDHLISQCNFRGVQFINCDASSDEEFLESVRDCVTLPSGVFLKKRFSFKYHGAFNLKCYDFKKQFTEYLEYMSSKLQKRRFESSPYIRREANKPRDKENDCIWYRPNLMKKARRYLLENFEYYQFCNTCLGSENDLVK